MAPYAESIRVSLTTIAEQITPTLKINFEQVVVSESGQKLTRSSASRPPTFAISTTAAKPGDTKYVAVCLDLDPPYPSMSILGPLAHGIQADLQPLPSPEPRDWITLDSEAVPVLAYVGPSPPPLSRPHRYLVMLWEQPGNLNTSDIQTRLGLQKEPGISGRIRWDEASFERKLGLGVPLAATYFLCS